MVVAVLFAVGVTAVQFLGLGLTAAKVSHAAEEAAYVAGSGVEASRNPTACWAVNGGLARPNRYADAAICQTVLDNLGDVDPNRVSVAVSPASLAGRGPRTRVHVTVTYWQPITSPLLRAFLGDRFVATSDAWSR